MYEKFDKVLRWSMSVLLMVAMLVVAARLATGEWKENMPATARNVKTDDTRRKEQKLVVLDPGHGGNDPGKVGINGAYEKDVNLCIATKIKSYLESNDIKVVMTRQDDTGLYEEGASNKKVQDMKARVQLIDTSGAVLAVSIHQNSFPTESVKGTQVFYYEESEKGKEYAELLQATITEILAPEKQRKEKANSDYYLLKKSTTPVVIVECGFLSNAKEAQMLVDDAYQERMAWAVCMGIMRCLNEME